MYEHQVEILKGFRLVPNNNWIKTKKKQKWKELYRRMFVLSLDAAAAVLKQINCAFILFDCCCLLAAAACSIFYRYKCDAGRTRLNDIDFFFYSLKKKHLIIRMRVFLFYSRETRVYSFA